MKKNAWIVAGLFLLARGVVVGGETPATNAPAPGLGPYETDAHSLLLMHFDGGAKSKEIKDEADPKAVVEAVGVESVGEGKFGKAVKISGGDGTKPSYVRVDSDKIALNGKSTLTIEAWLNQTNRGAGHQHLIAQSNMEGFSLGITGGNIWFVLYTEEEKWSGTWPGTARTRIPLNEWTHIAATYDGKAIRIYVNGEERLTKELKGGAMVVSGAYASIGERADLPGNNLSEGFKGLIDEVRISDVVRTFGAEQTEKK